MNYDQLAAQYKMYRRPDPRIAASIWGHLADAGRVLNVGAGIGSYEPSECEVFAVEPSEEMISLRSKTSSYVIRGNAEHLPFDDGEFDASMAVLTIHHWADMQKGLSEMLRVTVGKIVLLTWVGYGNDFWLEDYIPEIRGVDSALFPTLHELDEMLGPTAVETVAIPHDCSDGLMCAYWRRPEAYLNAGARNAISTFARIGDVSDGLRELECDLANGAWNEKYGDLLGKQSIDLGYRIVTCDKRSPKRALTPTARNAAG